MELPSRLGNYTLTRELGRGSMGTVYLARQESLGRYLAVKVLAPEFTRDEEFVERFRREALIIAQLRHPNIVQVYDADWRDGLYYIAMEYLEGSDLRRLMEELGGPVEVSDALRVADFVLAALHHAHGKGVVHRDVKPANIVVESRERAVLTDFSIAHLADATRLTRTGTTVGTPEYMAPEQFEGLSVDARADLYAVGVILYEMLTGVQPFRGETTPEVMRAHLLKRPPDPRELNRHLPEELAGAVLRALEKDPEARFTDAEEMRQALREASQEETVEQHLARFLSAVQAGKVSMDEAVRAQLKMKEAIDRGYRRILTVLMVDLVGSSRLKKPDQTLYADRLFREYRRLINEELERHGCMAYDWSGDGALCLFEEADPAVRTALTIQRRLEEASGRYGRLAAPLKARIGVNTGDVYLDPRRSLGEFASRTVDRAGHLEKDCPPGEVHVSEETARAAPEAGRYEEVGINRDGVTVYRVLPRREPARLSRFCPRCGAPALEKAAFCVSCGEGLAGAIPGAARPLRAGRASIRPAPAGSPPQQPPAASTGHAAPAHRPYLPGDSGHRPPPPEEAWGPAGVPPAPPRQPAAVPTAPPSSPGQAPAPAAATPPRTAPPFWWGWWMVLFSFAAASLGGIFGGSRQVVSGMLLLGGTMGLALMAVASPILAVVYLRRGDRLWALQAACGALLVLLLLGGIGTSFF